MSIPTIRVYQGLMSLSHELYAGSVTWSTKTIDWRLSLKVVIYS
jgi:hypothetical protein